jgi:hypothetical protein
MGIPLLTRRDSGNKLLIFLQKGPLASPGYKRQDKAESFSERVILYLCGVCVEQE